ncbi:MAG: hypothetical protein A2161_03600 [Candidatus Schekmanbacteria bacterium RBG_13_48_7]|uniref:histidine kinase n=1 Tax=Candidatus Schekmanbacteria bacterium RBG_13_48_7 TaxID=1817878 RepID=A0A1F7RNF3_9BACT|nr:MAG: hypothetical protein A2161_03600 [Candidatus Schekmanbacteria bacterium RBG_13_48_7]
MNFLRKLSLFQKLLILLLIVSVIPLLVSGYMLITINQEGLQEKIKELHKEKAQHMAEEINRFFGKVQLNLLTSIQSWHLSSLGKAERQGLLQLTLSQNIEDFRIVSLINLQGEIFEPAVYLPRSDERQNLPMKNEFNIGEVDVQNFYQRISYDKQCNENVYYFSEVYTSAARQGVFMIISTAKCEGPAPNQQLLVAAEISLYQLQNMISNTFVGRDGYCFLVDQDGVLVCHPNFNRVLAREDMKSLKIIENLLKKNQVFTMNYINKRGENMLGTGAPVRGLGWGVVIQESVRDAFKSVREMQIVASLITVFSLIFAFIVGFLFVRGITKPMSAFVEGAKMISKGDFERKIEVSSQDEIGELARAFNDMGEGLKQRDIELKKAYQQVIHSEKMAAFGQIGAGITHEIKNPLAGIIGQAMLALRKLKDDSPLKNNIQLIKSETERCLDIVKNLLTFTRQEKAVFEPVDIKHAVETTIRLIAHQLAIRGIDLQTELKDIPGKVHGNANQLEQILLNIIINAHDAMEDGGKLVISTACVDTKWAEILITDNGPGIPEEIRTKIFEPFFTTKEPGKGTGLGLSVSYGIIKEHNGKIEIDSEIGKGTTFRILLPLKSEDELKELEKERLANLRKEAAGKT